MRRLRELLREMRATSLSPAVAGPSAARFVRANVAFHAVIVSAANNPFLDRLYGQLQLQLQIVTYLVQTGFGNKAAERRQREHEAIARTLEARDARLLKKLLREHAATTEAAILKTLSETPPRRITLRGR
jgi:DNA-binding GntR family transcriptional regulator